MCPADGTGQPLRSGAVRELTPSERDWLEVRRYLQEHRHDLAVRAAEEFPASARMAGTPLLAAPGWLPAVPVPLSDISLELTAAADGAAGTPWPPGDAAALPERADGTRYLSYSQALAELAAPAVFENRVTYRLTAADLASGAPRLTFAGGRYFDGIDTGEAAAHEFAATGLGRPPRGPRVRLDNPCDLRRRPANLAISTLTLRLDRAAGRASFLVHRRDPARVGHAGGLYQVVPVGVFQPSGPAARPAGPDFSLWRCLVREFAEELAGHPEEYGGAADYEAWPFARQLTEALEAGQIRVWCLGLGTDPLTYATDLLTVAVIDSDVFDAWFSVNPRHNAEGTVLAAREFAAHVIDRTLTREPVQAAGAAVLRLAWQHREMLGS
jgi:hypothetical protein